MRLTIASGLLEIPGVVVPGKGTCRAQLQKRAGGAYILDLVSSMRVPDGCQTATFDKGTGVLDIPRLEVAGRTVGVELTRIPGGGLSFELTNVVK